MQDMASRLARLLADREDEFLGLGNRVMEFAASSQALAQQAGDLAELTSGEDVERGVAELSAEMEEMRGVCDFSAGEQSLSGLERVQRVIDSLLSGVASFGRIVRSLQMLGISTRIESARLGDQGLGFNTLADDVEKLAGKIVINSAAVMDKAKSLAGMINEARSQTGGLVEAQKGCSERILTDLRANLDGLTGLSGSSRELSASLVSRTQASAADISEVVASLQFHDIVRQQVEHVEEALGDMMGMIRQRGGEAGAGCAKESPSSPAGDDGPRELDPETRDLVGWVSDVSRLQESQLGNAAERFGQAMENFRGSLQSIAESIAGMSRDAEVLAGAGGQGGESVLDHVEKSTTSVIGSMREFALQAERIGRLMAAVAATVAEMEGFVEDIEEVGSEIELIALNASVKAARTGTEGRALGVLAQAIQKLSMEARDKTGEVSRVLTDISRGSQDLERAAAGYLDTSRLADMTARQEELMRRLRVVNTGFMDRLESVRRGGAGLNAAVMAVVRDAVMDRDICAELDAVRADMGVVVGAARQAVPLADDAHRSQRLKELLSRYTMEAERLVHEAAFGEGGGAARDAAEGEVELFDDGNVELF